MKGSHLLVTLGLLAGCGGGATPAIDLILPLDQAQPLDVPPSGDALIQPDRPDLVNPPPPDGAADLATDTPLDVPADGQLPDGPPPVDQPVTPDGPPPADLTADANPGPDGGPTPTPGQCYQDSQCPSGLGCVADGPGGICQGCGDAADDCPDNFDFYECSPGAACSRSCGDDSECVPGMECTGLGLCALQRCTDSSDCLSVHTCRSLGGGSGSTFCQRVACPAGTGCPTGTTCRGTPNASRVCVEDYLTF